MEPENGRTDEETAVKDHIAHIKARIFRMSEYGYIGMLVILTLHAVLSYVQADILWEEIGQGIPIIQFLFTFFVLKPNQILLMLVVIRHVCAERYDIKRILAAAAVYAVTAHAVEINHYEEVLTMILLMIGAWGISFRKLIKIYFAVVLTIVLCVTAASQIGWIEELVYEEQGRRRAFGFTYPTRFASHVFFLLLWYWYLRGKKVKYPEVLLPVGAGVVVLVCCKARLNAGLLLLLAAVMIWQIFSVRHARYRTNGYQMKNWFSSLLAMSPIAAALVITVLTVLYSADSMAWRDLNEIMSSRLSLTQRAMDIYGFQLWGREITLSGHGGLGRNASKYFYIDSAWMQFSLQYGLVLLVILLLLFWIVGIHARNHQEWVLLWILAFASLHAMIEPQMLQLQYSPLILAVFAELSEKQYEGNG